MKPTTLTLYDPNVEVKISVDASLFGLYRGCALRPKPVVYASRSMTPTERKYTQIEKQVLAIICVFSKFSDYICVGAKVHNSNCILFLS